MTLTRERLEELKASFTTFHFTDVVTACNMALRSLDVGQAPREAERKALEKAAKAVQKLIDQMQDDPERIGTDSETGATQFYRGEDATRCESYEDAIEAIRALIGDAKETS